MLRRSRREAVAKIIAPCFFVEPPVLFPHPCVIADALEVRRIENDDRESVIGKGKGAEISYKVRTYNQLATVAKLMLLGADITEHGALVLLVEPKHTRAAAHVKNGLLTSHRSPPYAFRACSASDKNQTGVRSSPDSVRYVTGG